MLKVTRSAVTTLLVVLMLTVGAGADELWWASPSGPGGNWSVGGNWYNFTTSTQSTIAPTGSDAVRCGEISGQSTAANPIVVDSAAVCASFQLSYTYEAYLAINANMDMGTGSFTAGGKATTGVTHNSGTVTAGDFVLTSRQADTTYTMANSAAILDLSGNWQFGRGDAGHHSSFQHQAGTVTIDGGLVCNSTGGTSYTGGSDYTLSGGTLTVYGNSANIGWKTVCEFNQTGGIATFGGTLGLSVDATSAGGKGYLTVADAAQLAVSGAMTVGSNDAGQGIQGEGWLVLDGSRTGAGTDVAANAGITFRQYSHFDAVVDDAAIATASDMRLVDVTGTATFTAGTVLLPSFDPGATPAAGTWTIMTYDSVSDGGLALDSSTAAGWSFDVGANALTVTYVVPEPTTMLLLAIGGLGAWTRRRRT